MNIKEKEAFFIEKLLELTRTRKIKWVMSGCLVCDDSDGCIITVSEDSMTISTRTFIKKIIPPDRLVAVIKKK